MSNDIIKSDPTMMPSKNELDVLNTIATQCFQSGFYKRIGGVPQLVAIALTARELGLPLMASINGGINIIEGRPEVSARMLNALILRSGGKVEVIKLDKTGCWLRGVRGDQSMEASFTWDDAIKAGLAGRKNWTNYTEDMLWARALSRLARRLWADLIGAAYVEGEIGDSESKPCHADVINPEIAPELYLNCTEIAPINEDNQAEIDAFYDSMDESDRSLMVVFLKETCKTNNWTEYEGIKRFKANNGKGKAAFDQWKSKKQSAA